MKCCYLGRCQIETNLNEEDVDHFWDGIQGGLRKETRLLTKT